MNFFEGEIAKYRRRVERLGKNINPNMLSSNRIFYQALLDENIAQLDWWRAGKPFVAIGGSFLAVLMRSFGDFRILNLVRIADRLGTGQAEAVLDKVREMGLPEYACDRTVLFLPLATMGEDLPRPKMIITAMGSCNVVANANVTLARMMRLPAFVVEVPFEDPYQASLPYVTDQLKTIIKGVEAAVPGAKFDERRLVEWQDCMRRFYAALHDIYKLRKHVPCPDHPRDVFREPLRPAQFEDPSSIIKYYESYRDELRARVEKNWSPVGEEKLRIVWSITGPYGSGIWDYLAKRGVSIPNWNYGGADRIYSMPVYGDTTEFGRKLTPLEEEARMMLYNSWGGGGERWIRDSVDACREFKADGLVQFEQTGCHPVQGLGHLVSERVEKELGIPSWHVEGRQLLGRSERTEAEFMSGLEAFVNLCFERKRERTGSATGKP